MKALTFRGKEAIRFESIADPGIIEPTDVIVKVKLCAICGSDLHVYHEREKGIDHGTAMGHEFMGEIVDVGANVKKLVIGDSVMSPFTTNCGTCFYCRIGLTCRCIHSQLFGWRENNTGLHGGQAEFVRVPMAESTLMRTPDGLTDDEALMLGDIIPTGFFCAQQTEIKPNGIYAVVGCGPVGLMAVLGAIELGASKVFAFDREPSRLAQAKRFGASPVNIDEGNAVAEIKDATEGRGADGVMEAVGSSASISLAFDLIRPGGILSAVGVCTEPHLPFSPTLAYNKNITYKVGRCPARYLMDPLTKLVQEKKYDFTSIITHRMKLMEGAEGYTIFANKKVNCLKVVMTP